MTRTSPVVRALALPLAVAAALCAAVLSSAPGRAAEPAAAVPAASSPAEAGDGGAVVSTEGFRREGESATPTPRQTPLPGERSPSPPPADVGSGVPVGWAVAGLGLALTAVAGAYAAGGRARGTRPPSGPDPRAMSPAPPAAGGTVDGLVDGLIAAHDLSTEPAVRASLEQTLRGVGVLPVAPAPGDAFDDTVQEVVGVRPAPGPADVGRVADVVRYGWSARHRLIRPAQVLVHQQP